MPFLLPTLIIASVPTSDLGTSPGIKSLLCVDPYTSHSADGDWTYSVQPSDRAGFDACRIEITRAGEQPVVMDISFAPRELIVGSDGRAVGYGYDEGDLPPIERVPWSIYRQLVFVALDGGGKVAWEKRYPVLGSRAMDSPYEPVLIDCTVQESRQRAVFLLASTHFRADTGAATTQELWTFQRQDGARVDRRALTRLEWVESIDAIPGRGLLLIGDRDGGFSLEDSSRSTVWRGGESGWRHGAPEGWSAYDFEQLRWVDPPVLTVDAGGFELWHMRAGQRVRYGLTTRGDGGISVAEESREAHPLPPPVSRRGPRVATIELDCTARHPLELGSAPNSPLADVIAWAPLQDGTSTVVRYAADGSASIEVLLLDAAGEVTARTRVSADEGLWQGTWIHLDGTSWACIRVTSSGDRETLAVDARSGPTTSPVALQRAVETLRDEQWDEVAIGVDGRVAVLVGGHRSGIVTFVPDGELLADGRGYYIARAKRGLVGVRDVAWTADGRLVVLDRDSDLHLLDETLYVVSTTSLEFVVGLAPRYPARLERTAAGGLLVEDFSGDPSLVHVFPPAPAREAAGFFVERALSPRLATGEPSEDRAYHAHVAPSSEVWTYDSNRLLKLDSKGHVASQIAPSEHEQTISRRSLWAVLGERIVVQDSATGAVHAFTFEGKWLGVASAEPLDAEHFESIGFIEEGPDGSVWIEREDDRCSRWSKKPERLGTVELGGDLGVSPTSKGVWRWRYFRGARRVDVSGDESEASASIERSTDGRWIRRLGNVEELADGRTIAYHFDGAGTPIDAEGTRTREVIVFLPGEGELLAERAYPAPRVEESFEVAGDWAVFSHYPRAVHLLRLSTGEWFRFAPGEAGTSGWAHGIARDGCTLVSVDTSNRQVLHFRLPD